MPTFDKRFANRDPKPFKVERPRRPWQAKLKMYGKSISLGSFVTREEAQVVEDKERIRYWQETGRL